MCRAGRGREAVRGEMSLLYWRDPKYRTLSIVGKAKAGESFREDFLEIALKEKYPKEDWHRTHYYIRDLIDDGLVKAELADLKIKSLQTSMTDERRRERLKRSTPGVYIYIRPTEKGRTELNLWKTVWQVVKAGTWPAIGASILIAVWSQRC